MSKPKAHVHKYERGKLGPTHEIYKCMLPDCTHYIGLSLAENKLSLCWGDCGNAVMMDHNMVYTDKTKRPICDECKELKRKRRRLLESIPVENS